MKVVQVSGRGEERREDFRGTLSVWPPRSRSGIFQVRPGDFRIENREGEEVIIAAWNIGPGDFECLEGFVRNDGTEGKPDKAAAIYEGMAGYGLSHVEAVAATIEELLK